MSPSSLLFYLGVSKKIKNLEHHNLFFDEDIEEHIDDIYKKPIWPKNHFSMFVVHQKPILKLLHQTKKTFLF